MQHYTKLIHSIIVHIIENYITEESLILNDLNTIHGKTPRRKFKMKIKTVRILQSSNIKSLPDLPTRASDNEVPSIRVANPSTLAV